jgi:hypothetical protein
MGTRRHRDRDRMNRLTAVAGPMSVLLLAGCGAAGSGATSGPGGSTAAPAAPAVAATSTVTATARMLTPPPRPKREPVARPGAEPAFGWTARKVTASSLGKSWRKGCPVRPARLRAVTVGYWGFDRKPHTGVLILNQDVVKRTRAVFETMFERRFPVRSIRPVSDFGASDDASMAADNTSAFNCRLAVAAGSPSWSRHAYGRAIDVNPVENPYLFGTKVLPPGGKKFTGRAKARRGLIRRSDPIHDAFLEAGYSWGGDFSNPDYQHFDR